MFSELVLVSLVSGFFTAITAILTGIISYKIAQLSNIAKETHSLVNGNMEGQLRMTAIASRRLADSTKDPKDVEIAETAEKLLEDHIKTKKETENKSAQSK